MSARNTVRTLFAMVAAGLLISPLPAAAETLCTKLIPGPDGSIPINERESERQVQARIKPGFIAEGDRLAGEGKLAAAVEAYSGVFGGHWYVGFYSDNRRCLPMDFYQGAADKLRAVASELAEQRRTKGYLLDESPQYGGDIQRGALRLYLISNQYDRFVNHALSYAESELLQRDIDSTLVGLVKHRLDELERTREIGTEAHNRQYVDDLTPLLDEELAAFDKLARFEERLTAHLAPLYSKITDHWLAEEERNFDDAIKTDGLFPKGMMFGQATDALNRGIKRLHEHPQQVARLKARANIRGEALMKEGREHSPGAGLMPTDHYAYAREYFEIAGNQEQYAIADRLVEEREASAAKRMEASMLKDIEKMQKSDEEQSAFQEETNEMAAEFGFDLDE